MTFSYDTRLLVCTSCGAAVDVPLEGGQVACPECGMSRSYRSFDEADPVDEEWASEPPDEGRRLTTLREQDRQALKLPPSLSNYGGSGRDLSAMLEDFRSTLVQIQKDGPFTLHERLFFLGWLSGHDMWSGTDDRKLRAVCQSVIENADSDQYRNVFHSDLSRLALREGDMQSAQQWLERCDAQSDDLLTDTAYRVAAAEIATQRGEFQQVLNILGAELDGVPTADAYDEHVELLRSNALEKLGRKDEAVAQLSAGMKRQEIKTYESARARNQHLDLCPTCYEPAKKAAQPGAVKRGLSLVGMLPALTFLIFPVMFCFSGTFLRACAPTPYSMAMDKLQACPAATKALGGGIDSTFGIGCGNMETGGGNGNLSWSVPVKGSKARGDLHVSGVQRGGTWTLNRLEVEVDDQTIDLLECTAPKTKKK